MIPISHVYRHWSNIYRYTRDRYETQRTILMILDSDIYVLLPSFYETDIRDTLPVTVNGYYIGV